MVPRTFGDNLKYYRTLMDLTQKELGKIAAVGQGTIANYERGLRFPGEITLRKIAEGLNVSLDKLLSIKIETKRGREAGDFRLEELISLLLKEDTDTCYQYLGNYRENSNLNLLEVFQTILIPTLEQTGKLWESGRISTAEEHVISSKIRELIIRSAKKFPQPTGNPAFKRKLWMGLCAPGEKHDLALLMGSYLMEEAGWGVILLGIDIPVADLVKMIHKHKPDIVCFSLTMEEYVNGLEAYLKILHNQRSYSFEIIIGSKIFPANKLKDYPRILGMAKNLDELLRMKGVNTPG